MTPGAPTQVSQHVPEEWDLPEPWGRPVEKMSIDPPGSESSPQEI